MSLGKNLPKVVPRAEVARFVSDCLAKAGATQADAEAVGDHLMTADYRGHFSHGLNRLEMYVEDIRRGLTDPSVKPAVVQDFQAMALVDGRNGLGQVIGKFCMDLAIEKAEKFGVGLVSARGSNHYGICGYYTLMAADRRMIGFSCTNTSPVMAPTRSRVAALGTNPISVAMKGRDDEFCLDMATTVVALGKIELAKRKQQQIPEGWALGRDGKVTRDPEEVMSSIALLPLGGTETNGGYKGYGLGLMVEVLCGVLSGSKFGRNIRSWQTDVHAVADLGHFFMAVNPGVFGEGCYDRLDELMREMRALPRVEESKKVMVAGDPENEAMKKVDAEGGITYHQNQIDNTVELARKLGVEPMRLVDKTA